MAILPESLLETPDYGLQGLEAIVTANMELLDEKAVIQNADGHQLTQAPATAAPDGEIANSRLHFSINESLDKIRFKFKKSGGAVVTHEFPGAGGSTDELIKITSNDTTAGYLFNKTVAGENIFLTEINDASNEDLEIKGLYPQGHINGLKLVYVSASSVSIGSGVALSADETTNLKLSSPITGDIATKLDTGTEAEAFYHVFLIYNPTTTTYDVLFSLSPTSPTMPAGFIKKRRVGFVRNNVSLDFMKFLISGNAISRKYHFQDTSLTNILSGGAATSFTAVDASYFLPVAISQEVILIVATGIRVVEIRKNGETVAYNYQIDTNQLLIIEQFTDGSGLIEYKNTSGGGSVYIDVIGVTLEL